MTDVDLAQSGADDQQQPTECRPKSLYLYAGYEPEYRVDRMESFTYAVFSAFRTHGLSVLLAAVSVWLLYVLMLGAAEPPPFGAAAGSSTSYGASSSSPASFGAAEPAVHSSTDRLFMDRLFMDHFFMDHFFGEAGR